jgi:hypothetical protein
VRRAALIVAFGTGCIRTAEPISLPESIAFVALEKMGDPPSPLIRLSDGPTALSAQEGVRLYAWTADQLAIVSPPATGSLPLYFQRDFCDPLLPAPAQVYTFDADGRLEPAEGYSSLSADWFSCPEDVKNTLLIDNRCVENQCGSELRFKGCRFELVSECSSGLSGRLLQDGTACMSSSTCEPLPIPGISTVVSVSQCETGCTVELNDTALLPPPHYESCAPADAGCRVSVRGETPPIVKYTDSVSLGRQELNEYLAADFVVLEDRVVVVRTGMPEDRVYCYEQPISLVSIDTETMSIISEVPAPKCVARIQAYGDNLLATTANFPPVLMELRLDGTIVRSTTIAMEGHGTAASITGLLRLDHKDRIVLTLSSADSFPRYDVVIVETSTFRIIDRWGTNVGRSSSPVLIDDEEMILHNDDSRRPQWFSIENDRAELKSEGTISNSSIGNSLYDPPTDSVLYETTMTPGIEMQSRTRGRKRVSLYINDSVPTYALFFDPEKTRLAVASSELGTVTRKAQLSFARLDDGELRFEARIMDLGDGVISKMELDAQQRLWILLSWTGELIRLNPVRN